VECYLRGGVAEAFKKYLGPFQVYETVTVLDLAFGKVKFKLAS